MITKVASVLVLCQVLSLLSPALAQAVPTNTVSTSTADAVQQQKCYDAYEACRIAPNANLNACSVQLKTCLGYDPFDVTPVTPTPAITSDAAQQQKCYDTYKACRIADNADLNACANQLTTCLGFSPFDSTTSSPAQVATAATVSGPAATTDAARQQKCYDQYKVCRTAANANLDTCGTQLKTCLGYNPFDSPSTTNTGPVKTASITTSAPAKYTGAGHRSSVGFLLMVGALGCVYAF